jgi:hypothetical protein
MPPALRHPNLAALALLAMAVLGTRARKSGKVGPLSFDDLRELARRVGFTGSAVDVAAAIAMAESGGDPHAQGDPHGPSGALPNGISSSFGLWQVHAPAHPVYLPARLLEPEYNARAAYEISAGGVSWLPWSTYNSGAYRQYLPPEPGA